MIVLRAAVETLLPLVGLLLLFRREHGAHQRAVILDDGVGFVPPDIGREVLAVIKRLQLGAPLGAQVIDGLLLVGAQTGIRNDAGAEFIGRTEGRRGVGHRVRLQ